MKVEAFLPVLATLLFWSGCASPCHHFSFHEALPGVFVGCRPKSQADFDHLHKCGIRTIVSYETFNWHVAPERRKAEQNRIAFVNVPIFASPFGPSEQSMRRALEVLSDVSLRPAYVHCLYGRDRTAIILGLYKVYYQGAPPEQTWQEIIRSGYHADLSLWGFTRYYWKHTQKPEWVDSEVPPLDPPR